MKKEPTIQSSSQLNITLSNVFVAKFNKWSVSSLHLFAEKMLLSILVVDQLMIYLLANLWGGQENYPCCEFSNGEELSQNRRFIASKWSLQFFNYLIGCSH